MTRRLAAVTLASVLGGLALTATPSQASPDYNACIEITTVIEPVCIWDYVTGQ